MNFPLLLKLTLIIGIIDLLNFTNFDLGYNTSLATENITSKSISQSTSAHSYTQADTQNADQNLGPSQYALSLQISNKSTEEKANLNSTDSFDPTLTPYFQTERATDAGTITITITNRWNNPLSYEITGSEGTVSYNDIIDASTETTMTISINVGDDLIVSANNKDGFRSWAYQDNGFIVVSGASELEFSSFVHFPDMRYFTTNESGTDVDSYFFNNFFRNTKTTFLPEGSFDISTITYANFCFFFGFNAVGNLQSLPEGSFNTANITQADTYFFNGFNYNGHLVFLPENSFNFDALESHNYGAFTNFNRTGSLRTLPADSFNMENVTRCSGDGCDDESWQHFNYQGHLTKSASGIEIKNTSSTNQTFDWAYSPYFSPGSETIDSGDTFYFYSTDDPNFVATPYFQSETVSPSSQATTITITNRWNATITALIRSTSDRSDLTSTIIAPASIATITFTPTTSADLTISASNKHGFRNWSDMDGVFFNGLITSNGPSASKFDSFTHIPDMNYFTTDDSGLEAGNWFFEGFFKSSKATSLPEGSFNISTITSVGMRFFAFFNTDGSLTSLPEDSFDTSSITSVGIFAFAYFNQNGNLTSLPEDSFDTSSISNPGFSFFSFFNRDGSLTSLPEGSFNTSSITTASEWFFSWFNQNGSLTSLPEGSFDISHITSVGPQVFQGFNENGSLTSLPDDSFNFSSLTTVDSGFFAYFNNWGSLTSLPEGSFNTSNIQETGSYFFADFNSFGALTSLPRNSFNFDSLQSHGDNFFHRFNYSGSLTSLPQNSFNLENVEICSTSSCDENSFLGFNQNGKLEKSTSGISIRNTSAKSQTFYWANGTKTNAGSQNIASGNIFCCYERGNSDDPAITNVSPKQVQNSKASSIIITGSNLSDPSYSFQMTSTRFGDSDLDNTSKTFSQIYPSASILNRTDSSATFIIPKTVGWVGNYFIELLREPELNPSTTFITYQLPLGTASKFTDISKLSAIRQANVKWLARTGVTGGCNTAGTKYCPEDPVNRGSMAVFLQLLAGYPAGSLLTSEFADVFVTASKTVTYISGSSTKKEVVSGLSPKRIAAVNWLSLTGITGGSGSAKVNGKLVPTYRPQDVVNRGSMATFMLKFSEDVVSTITNDGGTGFADVKIGSGNFTITYEGAKKGEKVAKVSAARATAIRWMFDWGITGGSGTDNKGNLTYRAQDAVNRGSMATFMKNLAVYMGFTS